MRTANTNCSVCSKPLYRRPNELKKYSEFCCIGCRSELYKRREPSENLELGREKGTNHLNGIPKSDNHKQKMSVIMSKWCSDNIARVKDRGAKIRGENHYLWNGGSSVLNTAIRQLTQNRKWMDAVKNRDVICAGCGNDTNLESHHIKELKDIIRENNITDRDYAREVSELWDLDNGIALCQKCHYQVHGRKHGN